tara:strand:- start:138 stop:569 length:432 start_codon:yes stop_codon:yes gene_type:complete
VSKPIEFSSFYKLLNAAKEGSEESNQEIKKLLILFKSGENSESSLHQLGHIFIYVGISELFNYAGLSDLKNIGDITKDEWEEIAEKKGGELPPYLANKMIQYAKEEKLSKTITKKWNCSEREINQNIMKMARYITEGIIDSIE